MQVLSSGILQCTAQNRSRLLLQCTSLSVHVNVVRKLFCLGSPHPRELLSLRNVPRLQVLILVMGTARFWVCAQGQEWAARAAEWHQEPPHTSEEQGHSASSPYCPALKRLLNTQSTVRQSRMRLKYFTFKLLSIYIKLYIYIFKKKCLFRFILCSGTQPNKFKNMKWQ